MGDKLKGNNLWYILLTRKSSLQYVDRTDRKVNRIFSLLTCVNNLFRPFEPKMEDHENISWQ